MGLDKCIHQTYNTTMIRTQIYIPEPLHQNAKLAAKKENKPVAALYRKFIAEGLEAVQKKQAEKSLDFLINLKFRGGPKDLSKNIDHYLYGAPRRGRK